MVRITIAEPQDAAVADDIGAATAVDVGDEQPVGYGRATTNYFRIREGDYWYWADDSNREFEGLTVLELTGCGVVIRWVTDSATDGTTERTTAEHEREYGFLTYDEFVTFVESGGLYVFGRDTGFERYAPGQRSQTV